MTKKRFLLSILLVAGLTLATGCAVPQPRGQGQYRFVQEPTTKTWYHLYLPVDYVRNNGQHPDPAVKRWPLVMSFHGMKPYDCATSQEREWEQQADIYGYVVCSPELSTSDSFMEYPLTKEHSYVLRDKRGVIAVMDHVFATTLADPKRVLSTSWSCGGYLAHYFPNRYPQRFSCIAVRLSNFSNKLMVDETVPEYRDRVPVAIFIGDGDFPACKTESEDAVAWYMSRGFRVVHGKMIDNMGHQRIPQTAAAFFAEQLGIKPLRQIEAAQTLAAVQMTDYQPPPQLLAQMSPRSLPVRESTVARADAARSPRAGGGPSGPAGASPSGRRQGGNYVAMTSGRNYPSEQTPPYDPTPERKPAVPESRGAPKPSAEPASAGGTKDSPSTPPSGAGATRVAQATPRSSNWLEPLRTSPSGVKETRGDAAVPTGPAAAPANPSSPAGADRPAAKADTAKDRSGSGGEGSRQPQTAKPSSVAPPPKEPTPQRPSARPFDPKDAGSRRYDVASAQKSSPPPPPPAPVQAAPPKAQPTQLAMDNRTPPPTMVDAAPRGSGAAPRKPSPHSPTIDQPSNKSKRVTIDLSGPAIGRAPHWIRYKIADLPPSVVAKDADFLWMDNGVWLNDEPSGARILDTPGRHEITVLVVGKNNEEYRGKAVVEVLEPQAPPVSAGRGS